VGRLIGILPKTINGVVEMRLLATAATGIVLVALTACAPTPPPLATPRPTPAPAPVAAIPYRPQPPGNAADTQQLPRRDAAGRFVTINSGITGERAFWQLKTGLNVAAIGCRGPNESTLVAAYNQIIKSHTRTIVAAEKKVIADLGKENRTTGVKERDKLSTQLFNYFAQPPAQRAFCDRAVVLAQTVATTPSAQLYANATDQLATLDQPFTDFYTAFERYKLESADWDARYGARAATGSPAMAASNGGGG
jgi:hypothetical protein